MMSTQQAPAFPFSTNDLLRVTDKTKKGTEVYTLKVTGWEWRQYRSGNVWGWYFGYVPSGLPDSIKCGFGYSWLFKTPMEYGVQSVEPVFCDITRLYLHSTMTSTKMKMEKMTLTDLLLVDSVYRLAQHKYESGGDYIVESMTPWEVLREFNNLAEAEQQMILRLEHANDFKERHGE